MDKAAVVKLLEDCSDETFMLHILSTDSHADALQKKLTEQGYEVVLMKSAFSHYDIIVTGRTPNGGESGDT